MRIGRFHLGVSGFKTAGMGFFSLPAVGIQAVVACVLMGISHQVFAKDLTSRLGVGFRNTYAIEVPAVAASYYPNADYGIIGALGMDTEDSLSRFVVTGGVRRIIFRENNMNFLLGGTMSLLSQERNNETRSGFELATFFGSEFFLPGLESLGFNLEAGVAVSNLNKVRFRTTADHILRAGVFFYF